MSATHRQMKAADERFCREILPRVSRTFALAIGVLPQALKGPVRLAYLLCRVADTLEDDTSLSPAVRVDDLERLSALAARLGGELRTHEVEALQGDLVRLASRSLMAPRDAEIARSWTLAGNLACVLRCIGELPVAERELIGECVREMALGMAEYVARERGVWLGAARAGEQPLLGALADEADLVHYADCVAGNVGRFLQRIFSLHLEIEGGARFGALERTAFHFSLGLQYTNIVQDVVADRRRGWCYIPRSLARRHGLRVEELLDARYREGALEVVKDLIRKSLDHLEGALEFTLLLPRRAPRIRLFCLWPLFLALATLTRAWGHPAVLEEKVKLGRAEVRRLVRATSLRCLWERALRRLFARESLWLQARM